MLKVHATWYGSHRDGNCTIPVKTRQLEDACCNCWMWSSRLLIQSICHVDLWTICARMLVKPAATDHRLPQQGLLHFLPSLAINFPQQSLQIHLTLPELQTQQPHLFWHQLLQSFFSTQTFLHLHRYLVGKHINDGNHWKLRNTIALEIINQCMKFDLKLDQEVCVETGSPRG